MRIAISIKRVVSLLIIIMVLLAGLTVGAQLYKTFAASPLNLLPLSLFDVRKEESLHTWYSEVLLLFCSVLFAVIWLSKRRAGDRYASHWGGLAVILLYLSVDEGASIHEKMGQIGKLTLGFLGVSPSGFLTYAWIVPASGIVLIVTLVYVRFFLHLARREQLLFGLSAVLFVGGAILLEALSAYYVSFYGGQQAMAVSQRTLLIFITTGEETAEVAGVIVLVYTLLAYLKPRFGEVTFEIKGSTPG